MGRRWVDLVPIHVDLIMLVEFVVATDCTALTTTRRLIHAMAIAATLADL